MRRAGTTRAVRARAFARAVGIGLLAATVSAATVASTRVMDDIEIIASNGTALIRLSFTVPLQYLRHFPASEGELLNIFLQAVSQEAIRDASGTRLLDEVRRSKRTDKVPCFTVSVIPPVDVARGPVQLVVQFSETVYYRVEPGRDGRSINLEIRRRDGAPKEPADCKAEPA